MTRIAILGGGLSGRLTALQLAEQGADAQAPAEYADALGRAVAKKLADDGARELIGAVLNTEN